MNLLAASRLERFVVLLPALVVGVGLVTGVFILLGRAFVATIRDSRHPRLIYGGVLVIIGAVALLTWLGVELPRE